jgi:hypothetical protein
MLVQQVEHQCQWSINMWCDAAVNCIFGPHFIEGDLNVERYTTFLLNILPLFLRSHTIEKWNVDVVPTGWLSFT